MKKIIIVFLSIAFLFQSCTDKKKVEQNADEVQFSSNDDASIYLLESEWKNQDDKEMRLKDLKGKVVIFTMMFTSCKASCPKLVADVQRIEKSFDPESLENLNFVLCTIDPEYDTPARLKAYAAEHNLALSHWTLLTSSQENVREISAILGVKYKKTSPMEFSHSNIISVFNSNGELYWQQEGIEGDVEIIVEKIEGLMK